MSEAAGPRLTKEQQKAVQWITEGRTEALQLVAGAGSGKTGTIIQAAVYTATNYCPPSEIAMITFTKKAAEEMKERLSRYNLTIGFVGTMHALAYSLLKKINQIPGKLLTDDLAIKSKLLIELFPGLSHIPTDVLLSGRVLNRNQNEKFIAAYRNYKTRAGTVDFDDLILKATALPFSKPPFQVLFVDEFQDTSPDQLQFVKQLCPKKLVAVGDDWQSIYKFRGADVCISREFLSYFENSQRLFLTRNFRSQKRIVALGNRCIQLSNDYIKKTLRSHFKKGTKNILYLSEANNQARIAEIFISFSKKIKKKEEPKTYLVRTNAIAEQLKNLIEPEDRVLTIHSSKGLEFENVIVFGVARHILPHRWSDPDEEIRLLYVAITRAQKSLAFVSWQTPNENSDFLPFLAKNCKIIYF